MIIFTEYLATQNWLMDVLAGNGYGGADRLMTLYGGMDTDAREAVKAAFQASPDVSPVRILLATDAASEGIDLQNHCHLMVHTEIPWNPNRLEQRNGRIDRFGQHASEVLIHHFVGAGYEERDFDAEHPGGIEGRSRVPDACGAQGRVDPAGPRSRGAGNREPGRGSDAWPSCEV